MEHYDRRKLVPKRLRANNTKPPRTRAGATYPGGKHMRKALARLNARRTFWASIKTPNPGREPGAM